LASVAAPLQKIIGLAVLGKTEDRTDFIREAVERELVRREVSAHKEKKRRQ
jgi:hypothetical protein